MERKKNSNNNYHLLKPWFVYISQVFSVAFTVIPPLPHLIRKETETNTWSQYPGLFSPKAKPFLPDMLSLCLQVRLTPGHHYFLWLSYVHPLISGIQKEISRGSLNLLSSSRCLKDDADLLLIRVIDDISEQQQNLLETLWSNVLILLQKHQRSRQVTGHVQSDSRQVMKLGPELSSVLLLHAGPPFLPRKEWIPTPCPKYTVHVYKHHIMLRRSAMQLSPAEPLSTESMLHTSLGWVKPQDTAHIIGPVTPWGSSRVSAPRIWSWAVNVEMRCLIAPGLSFTNYKMRIGTSKTLIKNE